MITKIIWEKTDDYIDKIKYLIFNFDEEHFFKTLKIQFKEFDFKDLYLAEVKGILCLTEYEAFRIGNFSQFYTNGEKEILMHEIFFNEKIKIKIEEIINKALMLIENEMLYKKSEYGAWECRQFKKIYKSLNNFLKELEGD